ncbi:MAG: SpoIIE family protein phosphatase [Firmicutes bacterium]|nr:SpoIIE family protein phosphatase [Bacillota bacterium]
MSASTSSHAGRSGPARRAPATPRPRSAPAATLALFAVAVLFGRAALLGVLAPFGPALVAAVDWTWGGPAALVALAGTVLGAATSGGPLPAAQAFLLGAAAFLYGRAQGTAPAGTAWWGAAVAGAAALIGAPFAIRQGIAGAWSVTLFQAALIPLLASLYAPAAAALRPRRGARGGSAPAVVRLAEAEGGLAAAEGEPDALAVAVGAATAAAVAIGGMGGIAFGPLDLRTVLVTYVTLAAARLAGAGAAAATGIALGAASVLMGSGGPVLAAGWGLGGLLAGAFAPWGRGAAVFGLLAGSGLALLPSPLAELPDAAAGAGLVAGALAFLLTPERVWPRAPLRGAGWPRPARGAAARPAGGVAHAHGAARRRSTLRVVPGGPGMEGPGRGATAADPGAAARAAAGAPAPSPGAAARGAHASARATAAAPRAMAPLAAASYAGAPRAIAGRAPALQAGASPARRAAAALARAARAVAAARRRRAARRAGAAGTHPDLHHLASVFRKMADTFDPPARAGVRRAPAAPLAERLREAVCTGCPSHAACWQREGARTRAAVEELWRAAEAQGRLSRGQLTGFWATGCRRPGEIVVAANLLLDHARRDQEWERRLSGGRSLAAAQLRGVAGVFERLAAAAAETGPGFSAPVLRYQVGVAKRARPGRLVSGDTHLVKELEGNQLLVVLSDGMGVGPEAARQSQAAVTLLEGLLDAGVDCETAVHGVNATLLLRSYEESFATLDLALIDRREGTARFLKVGAAPGYILRGGEVAAVRGGSVPLGILREVRVEFQRHALRPGDVVVLVSDGVWDASRQPASREDWVRGYLAAHPEADPARLAAGLVEEAARRARDAAHDDLTALVVRLLPGMVEPLR